MPRKRGRGGRRGGKRGGLGSKRELVFKDEGEEYAQVLKLLGSGRMDVMCMDGKRRRAKVRGKFKRRVWIHVGDIILATIREFENEKCDIVHLYYADEAKTLKQMGEIPQDIEISETQRAENNELDISFGDKEEEEEKNAKKKSQKQNLDSYMPEDSDASESDDEAPQIKEEKKPKQVQPSSILTNMKAKEVNKKTNNKVGFKDVSESESDSEDNKSSEEEKEKDELNDV